MKHGLIFIAICSMMMSTVNGQDVMGKWYSLDPETGKNESIIEVYKNDNKLYAKIIKILKKEDRDKTCIECTGKDKDKPILGMVIVRGLSQDGNEWGNGKVLDPKNGKLYKCYITLVEKNKLKLRGYIGFSLIGRTEYWHRVLE
jgi:uncharacterized protein (DUF2147 family)